MADIDELIRTRRRTLSLLIGDDGRLIVRAPLRLARSAIDDFVKSKEKWIALKQEQARKRMAGFAPKAFVSGEEFLYLGERYRLEIADSQSPALIFNAGFHLSRAALPRARSVFERWYRRQGLRVISKRVDQYASEYGFEFSRIKITSARKQWGSCAGGNLRFAWRLMMAPLPIIDYVVVHELVHLRHRNHSKRFWSRLASILPDFRQREEWLEEHGHLLRLG